MASKRARKPNRAVKKIIKPHFKKQLPQHKKNNSTSTTTPLDYTSASSCSSLTTPVSPQETTSPSPVVLTSPVGGCCTPKTQKSRIPEMKTCPPAPKKQRVTQNRLLRRRQIVFFAPPEIELFFLNAHNR